MPRAIQSVHHLRIPTYVWKSDAVASLRPRERSLLLRFISWHNGSNNGVICASRQHIKNALNTQSNSVADKAFTALVKARVVIITKPGARKSMRWIALSWLKLGETAKLNLEKMDKTTWHFPGGNPSGDSTFIMLPTPKKAVREDFFDLHFRAQVTLIDVLAESDGTNNGHIRWGTKDIRASLGSGRTDARSAIHALLDGGWLIETAPSLGCSPALYGIPWQATGSCVTETMSIQLVGNNRLHLLPDKYNPDAISQRQKSPRGKIINVLEDEASENTARRVLEGFLRKSTAPPKIEGRCELKNRSRSTRLHWPSK